MSIIDEALKKAQTERQSTKDLKPTEVKASSKRSHLVLIVILFLVAASIVAAYVHGPDKILNFIKIHKKTVGPVQDTEVVGRIKGITETIKAATSVQSDKVKSIDAQAAVTLTVSQVKPMASDKLSTKPSLSGIMYMPGSAKAIVDGQIVREGDTINKCKIKKILVDKVIVELNGETMEIELQ